MRSPDLIDWLEDNVIRLEHIRGAEQPAYVFLQGDNFARQDLSHRDLLIRAKSLAASIQSRASFGDRAILLYPSGLDYIVAFFACLYAGVIAVPAFPPSTRRRDWGRIDAIFKNADPTLVLTTEALCESIKQWQQEQSGQNAAVVATDGLDGSDIALWQRPPCSADSVAFLQYSSGSTGTPKGVMVTHANIRHNLQVIADGFSLNTHDRGASWLPIYHDMGLIGSVLEPFNLGLSIYLMSPLDVLQKPARWLQAITDFKVTGSGGPNFIYEHCVNRIKEDEKASLDLSSWQLAFNGAEPVSRDTMERFARAFESCGFQPSAFTPCYGMAETTLMVSSCARDEPFNSIDSTDTPANTSLVCSGTIHPDFRVKIVNPDTHIECADGQTGEIWVQGASVASGYWQQDELSEQTFRARLIGDDSLYLRTGDLGIKHGQSLYVTGRIKELIIIRGQNHYPRDIEASVAQSCEALSGCSGAAFSVAVDGAEQLVVVHEINRRFMRDFGGEKILANVRRAVAENHQLQIQSLVLIKPASLLRTTSGKVRRVAMREAFLNEELSSVYRWSAGETNAARKGLRETSVSKAESFPGMIESDFSYSKDGGDIGQGAAGEDHGLDAYPKRQEILVENSTADAENTGLPVPADSNTREGNKEILALNNWMRHWIATRLQLSPDDVNTAQEFVSFGLDSVDAVELTHELGAEFGIAVKPDLAWVYPNISSASEYLVTLLNAATPEPAALADHPEEKWLEGDI